MKIKRFRELFPEYGDMTDGELAQVMSSLLSDLTDEDVNESQHVHAPEVTAAVKDVCKEIESATAILATINSGIKAISGKKDKEEKDLAPYLMAMGVQLQSIEAALKAMAKEEVKPEKEVTPMQVCTSFKIVRDEIGQIDKVIPKYEAR